MKNQKSLPLCVCRGASHYKAVLGSKCQLHSLWEMDCDYSGNLSQSNAQPPASIWIWDQRKIHLDHLTLEFGKALDLYLNLENHGIETFLKLKSLG